MKKQFFYAAFALAFLAGCSNDDAIVVNDEPQNEVQPGESFEDFAETENFQIQLGAVAPGSARVTTRGTGSVAGTAWTGEEKLRILMYAYEQVKDNDGSVTYTLTNNFATEEINGVNTPILGNVEFTSAVGESDVTGLRAKYIQGEGDDKYEVVKYYPLQGKFAFYGYYVDDITGYTAPADGAEKLVAGVAIDGSNDVMAAKTIPFTSASAPTSANDGDDYAYTQLDDYDATADWSLITSRSFSAWTARRGVQPILSFQHLLSQFTFKVYGGNAASVSTNNDVTNAEVYEYEGAETPETKNINTGVTIEEIYVEGQDHTFDIDLNAVAVANPSGAADAKKLSLKRKSSSATSKRATLVNLNDENEDAIIPEATDATDAINVGESLMLLPSACGSEVTFQVKVSQYVVYQRDAAGNALNYVKRTATLPAKVAFGDLQNKPENSGTLFAAGNSYEVTLCLYGFQEIQVYAKLAEWKQGGTVEVSPEDQYWN